MPRNRIRPIPLQPSLRILFGVAFLCLFLFPPRSGVRASEDFEQIRQKVRAELLAPEVQENRIRELMSALRPDGTWPGIDYQDVSNTGFQHSRHLNQLVELSRAYRKKGTPLGGDPGLKKTIDRALDYWLAHDFLCQNWWYNQIGTPTSLSAILLILDEELKKEQVEKALPMVARAHLNASGARPSGDRIKIAGILAKALLFQRNEEQFAEVCRVMEEEIRFNTGLRGMQHDYSFHHREDRVNNTLSYGLGYAETFAEWAALVAGTRFQFSGKSLQQLTDYYLDGICKQMVYGKFEDPGTQNRDITRKGSDRPMGTTTLERLLQASPYRKSELEEMIRIRSGQAAPTLSHATFFWQSEHFSFQRPDFFASVRMHSTRNNNMEMPYNSEGLMNHHRGDGTSYLSVRGDEYRNLSPVYDWQKIPGATVLQKPELPPESEIQKQGLGEFAGAVTDGLYGAAAFDFRSPHDPLGARKAWFFFDKEYVCLGTDIRSKSRWPAATTLNQCRLRGEVVVSAGSGQPSALPRGEHLLETVQWILHDGVGYLFPAPQKARVSNQEQSGSWYRVNRQHDSPREEVREEVFKLWLDHGVQPSEGKYEYIVLPGATEKSMGQAGKQIRILANTSELQAVCHDGLNLCQVIFHTSGEIALSEQLKMALDSPGAVMIRTDGKTVRNISVADPMRKLGRMHLTLSGKVTGEGAGFFSRWSEEKGSSEIAIDLPQKVYAGKSVTVAF